MCFRIPAKTRVPYVPRAFAQTPFSRWVHKRSSGIPGPLKPDTSVRCKRCTGQARPVDGRPITEVTVGREKLEVVPSFCNLPTAYPQVAIVNSLSITRWGVTGANWMSFCQSSRAVHFPSPLEEEFTIRASRAPCPMQARPGPQPDLICIACNTMTELWSAEYMVSPPRSALKTLWRGCSLSKVLPIRRPRWPSHVACSDGWLKKIQKLKSTEGFGHVRPNTTSTEVIGMDCLALGLTETLPSDMKAWSGRLKSDVRLDPPQNQGVIKSSIN